MEAADGDAGMGHRVATLAFVNVGAGPCTLDGYPSVTLLDADGTSVETVRVERSGSGYLRNSGPPSLVVVQPNGRGYFDLAWTVIPNEAEGETTCPEVSSLRLTPPAGGGVVELDQAFTACGGRVEISSLRSSQAPSPPPA